MNSHPWLAVWRYEPSRWCKFDLMNAYLILLSIEALLCPEVRTPPATSGWDCADAIDVSFFMVHDVMVIGFRFA